MFLHPPETLRSPIRHKLGPKYIRLPKTEEEMIEKSAEFATKFGMHQALMVLMYRLSDHLSTQDYLCYKQYFSITVQAVCDYKGMFMDIDCKWPGSVHNANVFSNSSIGTKLRNYQMPITYQEIVPGRGKVPNYLIGDPANPLITYCVKEYETFSSNSQVLFNSVLRSARNPVECAFGRLKAQWRKLTYNPGQNY